MQQSNTKNDNDFAVASLALGVLAVTGAGFFTGIPAIIFGALGLKNPANKGLSIAGLVMGIVATVVSFLLIAFFLFILALAGSTPSKDSGSEQFNRTGDPAQSTYQKA